MFVQILFEHLFEADAENDIYNLAFLNVVITFEGNSSVKTE